MDSAITNWHATFAIEVAMSVNIRECVLNYHSQKLFIDE